MEQTRPVDDLKEYMHGGSMAIQTFCLKTDSNDNERHFRARARSKNPNNR